MKKQNTTAHMDSLTATCVAQINKQAEIERKAWCERGRLIKDYITKSKMTQHEALKRLVAHPDCVHGISQLRNYMKAYEVYSGLGDLPGCERLPMTHFVVLQDKKLTPKKREELLRKAVKEDLSVSELKDAISRTVGDENREKSDAEMLIARIERVTADLGTFTRPEGGSQISDKLHDEVVTSVQKMVEFAFRRRWIDIDALKAISLEDAA